MSFKPYTEKIIKKEIGICLILGRIRIRIQNRTRIRIHHSGSGSADPEADPWIRIRIKMIRIRNTAVHCTIVIIVIFEFLSQQREILPNLIYCNWLSISSFQMLKSLSIFLIIIVVLRLNCWTRKARSTVMNVNPWSLDLGLKPWRPDLGLKPWRPDLGLNFTLQHSTRQPEAFNSSLSRIKSFRGLPFTNRIKM